MSKESANRSFTKNLYDSFNTQKKNKDATFSYNYITDSLNESNEGNKYNQFLRKSRNIPSNEIDAETDIRRSQDTRNLSNWECFNKKRTADKKQSTEITTRDFVPEYTRLKKPCNIYSGININRFYPLFEDAQDSNNIQSNSYIGTNTRLQIKDAFKKESNVNFKL